MNVTTVQHTKPNGDWIMLSPGPDESTVIVSMELNGDDTGIGIMLAELAAAYLLQFVDLEQAKADMEKLGHHFREDQW